MKIVVNNESFDLPDDTSLEALIGHIQIDETNGIALALNETIIPRSEWDATVLSEGDKVIIIGAVAGG